jgi:hypothetical protein
MVASASREWNSALPNGDRRLRHKLMITDNAERRLMVTSRAFALLSVVVNMELGVRHELRAYDALGHI